MSVEQEAQQASIRQKEDSMKIELTELEYELLNLFRALDPQEKITVLSAGSELPSAPEACASPVQKAV